MQTKNAFSVLIPLFILLFLGALGGYVYWCLSELPETDLIELSYPYESSEIYSGDNQLLAELYIEKRNIISSADIPEHVKQAFIAVEDKRFNTHIGIDFYRIAGALVNNIKNKNFSQGASTITQQLAKMFFLSPEKTITRKIKEIAISIKLERKYSKDEILGMYLNHLYLGTRAYGIEAASQTYFGKSTQQLTISEAALLATLPKAPSENSPFKSPERAVTRRNFALKRMYEVGFINQKQYSEAVKEPITAGLNGRKYNAPYFVDALRAELEERFGHRLFTSGLQIYTTLDYSVQIKAEKAIEKGISDLNKRGIENIQAALVAIDRNTGGVVAMVGGADYRQSQFNRATQAKRQPGSAFKPIVYAAALCMGFSADDIINDNRVAYVWGESVWAPRNYDNVYHGDVAMNKALANSLNSATVNLAQNIGINNVIKTAKKLGIKSSIYPFASCALGTSEMTLMELAGAYAVLSHGFIVEPYFLEKVIDRNKRIVIDKSLKRQRVLSEKAVAGIRSMLYEVITSGTGRRALTLKKEVYGKTGTSSNSADAWFVGFDDRVVAGVWVGRDSNISIAASETGASAALPIWVDFMKSIE